MHAIKFGVALSIVALGAACGSESANGTSDQDAVSAGGNSTAAGTPDDTFGQAEKSLAAEGCSDAAKDIYVLSNDFELYRFHPGNLSFTRVGQFDCMGPKNPNFLRAGAQYYFRGMAIDRAGRGWLVMMRWVDSLLAALAQPWEPAVDQALVEFSTTDASCKAGEYEPVLTAAEVGKCMFVAAGPTETLDSACQRLGARAVSSIAYASKGNTEQSLYGFQDYGLISIDPISKQRARIGPLTEQTEDFSTIGLAGTGDGRLFELSIRWKKEASGDYTYTYTLAQRDRATANAIATHAVDFESIRFHPTAMTFWGGDLWFFGIPADEEGNAKKAVAVVRYNTETKTLTTVIDSISNAVGAPASDEWKYINGAANSTCAPLTAPK